MDKQVFRWVVRHIRRRIPAIVLLTITYVGNALLSVVFALGSKDIIDSAVAGDGAAFRDACILQALVILGLLATRTFDRNLRERLTANMEIDWKRQLLHGLLHGDFSAISKYHSGELLNRLNNDVAALDGGILALLPGLCSMITKIIAAMAVLVAMEPLLTLAVVVGGAAMVLLTGTIRKRLKELNKTVSMYNGKVSGFLQETMEKLLMVQAMDVSTEIEKRADGLMNDRYRIVRKRKNIALMTSTITSTMAYAAAFISMVWCSSRILAGTMTYGSMMVITQLVGQLRAPFSNLSGIMPQYVAMTAAAERLMELDTLLGDPVPTQGTAQELYDEMTALGAQELCFAYDRDRVFDGASFCLPKGEFGVIMGHSGIGKSTLLKLMLGVFHPESGQLFVDTPQGRIPLDRATRRLFAYVPQGNLLLSGTLRENLTITRPDATEEEIAQAVHISAMDDYLGSLPEGLETVIGESALGLSEGQAQRLSIARAVLSQAPILLLDEATSALDAQTEETVLKRLRGLGKTCIAVTHRPAAVALSDWSLEMHAGKCILTRHEQ